MADPTSTPLPAYITPFGEAPKRRVYLVEQLSEKELQHLGETPSIELAAVEEDLVDPAPAANDSAERSVSIVLFVGNSHLSRRMLRTARDLVRHIGERRASLRVLDLEDKEAAREATEQRVTFTPTVDLITGETRVRVVGAASLDALLDLLPDFAG